MGRLGRVGVLVPGSLCDLCVLGLGRGNGAGDGVALKAFKGVGEASVLVLASLGPVHPTNKRYWEGKRMESASERVLRE